MLLDYYLEPDNVHRLSEALCDLYCGYIERSVRELRPHGFWTSDDLGLFLPTQNRGHLVVENRHQKQLFVRPELFREFMKPYCARIGAVCQEQGVHWWLHSCGNNTDIMGDLAEVGLDVFHPVQKGTMDEVTIVGHRNGGRVWRGDDLSGGNRRATHAPGVRSEAVLERHGVREEVRFLIDTFDRPDGGMCIAAENGIVGGTPLENIAAFLDESVRYGTEHRRRFAG